jgi:hypothetical protein
MTAGACPPHVNCFFLAGLPQKKKNNKGEIEERIISLGLLKKSSSPTGLPGVKGDSARGKNHQELGFSMTSLYVLMASVLLLSFVKLHVNGILLKRLMPCQNIPFFESQFPTKEPSKYWQGLEQQIQLMV